MISYYMKSVDGQWPPISTAMAPAAVLTISRGKEDARAVANL